jgi:hypothetical protein
MISFICHRIHNSWLRYVKPANNTFILVYSINNNTANEDAKLHINSLQAACRSKLKSAIPLAFSSCEIKIAVFDNQMLRIILGLMRDELTEDCKLQGGQQFIHFT